MSNEILTLGDLRQQSEDDYLEHFGVKGMKWGIRHLVGADGRVSATPGVPSHINREAHADAQHHVHLTYASRNNITGRLLYQRHAATVNAKARANPDYRKAFLHHKNIEEDKALKRQLLATAAIGTAWALYHFNGYSLKVNGPLLQNTSKAVVTGAKFVAKIGPKMMNDYKFSQIVKDF
jgi:hypothetical protein